MFRLSDQLALRWHAFLILLSSVRVKYNVNDYRSNLDYIGINNDVLSVT